MKISIQKIIRFDDYPFDESVDISEIENWNNDIRRIGSVHVTGHANAQGNQITCYLTITGTMILPCARTLIDVTYPFEVDAVEVFSTDPYYQEEDESEIHPIDGEVLDLDPYIKENVLLEIPFRVYASQEEIDQFALTSGEGWDIVSEQETEEPTMDPRMQKLQDLLNEKEDKENQ
ncbi:YceD family protein [Paraliobacillus ryukyuensis]|uniref:YceD family protein n=1 Tax=Paraliobacillus ryukyuensis TaxID=200904 RepID=UPI0009A64CF5|nr:YceD family protein [Paraliobacillus ryukyuensis]